MKKRALALVLAGAMTLGASMTVFAADAVVDNGTTTEATVTGTGKINTPTIKVTVPTAFDVVLNPFQIAYEIDSTEYKTQIVTAPQLITNESDVAVAVNVKDFTATPSSGVTLQPKAVGKATDKSVYLYLEVVSSATDDATKAKFAGSGLVPAGADADEGAKKDAVVTLAAGNETPTYAAYKMGGDMVVNPVDEDGASTPWAASDKVDVSFKFTFTPQMASGK